MAYISSSSVDNGVDNFVSNNKGVRVFSDCLTLANSGSVGTAFYHPYKFVASDHVTKLSNPMFNKHIYLFLAAALTKLSEKYSFNREINDKRIKKEKIMLPVDETGNPDYDYMEKYMRWVEYKRVGEYLNHRNNQHFTAAK